MTRKREGRVMKRLILISCFVAVAVLGCKEPTSVVLDREENLLEVTALPPQDPDVELSAIDSTAILPSDENAFAGLLIVNKVTYDAGTRVDSFAFSKVFFADRIRPVRRNQRTIGFHGFNLGPILLNNSPMNRIPHIIRMKAPQADTVAGFEYVKDLTTTYQSNQTYTWAADSINATGASIVSPGELRVLAPVGGASLSRDQNLELLWRGEGNISIFISTYDPVLQRTRALLHVRPRVNRGRAVLGVRLLRLLPPGRNFVFTFVLSNKRLEDVFRPYRGQVLLQASEVYNTLVTFP